MVSPLTGCVEAREQAWPGLEDYQNRDDIKDIIRCMGLLLLSRRGCPICRMLILMVLCLQAFTLSVWTVTVL